MSKLTIIRTLAITNGTETREVSIVRDERGFWLDDNGGLVQIADDSDMAVMDVVRDNGFEIVEDAATGKFCFANDLLNGTYDVLVWASEAESVNDDGAKAIARKTIRVADDADARLVIADKMGLTDADEIEIG